MRIPLFFLTLIVFLAFGCQKEELTIVETPPEASFMQDDALVKLMQSVAAHDGRFDDVIDKSSCFSINFPYQIRLNQEILDIKSVNDLLAIDANGTIIPVFPITISFADYISAQVASQEGFTTLVENCANGLLYDERITCVDFVYPISIAVYNTDSSNFETIQFDHDQNTFESITDFNEATLASINYPVQLKLYDDTTITVESNAVLKERILNYFNFCE